jgi:uncharacterized protein YjbJ (UPF0337 family)
MKDEKVLAGKGDRAKGRIKEAAGRLKGDRKMVNEGKAQHAKGAIREGVHTVADKARDVIDDAKR